MSRVTESGLPVPGSEPSMTETIGEVEANSEVESRGRGFLGVWGWPAYDLPLRM